MKDEDYDLLIQGGTIVDPGENLNTENLREPLEKRLNPLIYKEHEEFNFLPQR